MSDVTQITISPAKLRQARKDRKQVAVARAIGISKQRLSNYECGLFPPSSEVLAKLLVLYGVKIEDVIDYANKSFLHN